MFKYGLIGRDIEYSHSERIHKIIGDYDYELLDVQNEDELEALLRDGTYCGFNVTTPYKKSVIKYMDELSETARRVGAVNTISRTVDGKLIGYNTDVDGFVKTAHERAANRKCLILGTGGAALAVAEGLENLKASEIIFASRDPNNVSDELKAKYKVVSYDELNKHYDVQVIINATPVGLQRTIEQSPITNVGRSLRSFASLEFAMDLIYNPYRTKFIQDARRLTGCKTASGLEMLIHQAISSRNIWKDARNMSLFEKVATSAIKRRLLVHQLNIVAVGMPGSGKTSIFRKYATEMGLEFIDIDKETEKLMGESIETVLKREDGEEYFRQYEQKAVMEACKHNHAVIATGGGSILNPVSRDMLRANGIVIYVRRPLDKLAIQGRPLSEEYGVEELFEKRDTIYRKVSDICIDNNITFGETFDKKGNKNSYTYDMKKFVYGVKTSIDKYIFNIAGNKWV